jgi:hypothetical protein
MLGFDPSKISGSRNPSVLGQSGGSGLDIGEETGAINPLETPPPGMEELLGGSLGEGGDLSALFPEGAAIEAVGQEEATALLGEDPAALVGGEGEDLEAEEGGGGCDKGGDSGDAGDSIGDSMEGMGEAIANMVQNKIAEAFADAGMDTELPDFEEGITGLPGEEELLGGTGEELPPELAGLDLGGAGNGLEDLGLEGLTEGAEGLSPNVNSENSSNSVEVISDGSGEPIVNKSGDGNQVSVNGQMF